MNLIDVVRTLDSLDPNATIYATEPWSSISEIVLVGEGETSGPSPEAKGMKYLLEVFIANEVMDGFASQLGRKPTDNEKCERLIDYAINDA
jgi:hypothetical protein